MPSRVTRMSHLTLRGTGSVNTAKSDVLQRQVDPPDMNGAWCTASRRSRPAAVRGLRGSGRLIGTRIDRCPIQAIQARRVLLGCRRGRSAVPGAPDWQSERHGRLRTDQLLMSHGNENLESLISQRGAARARSLGSVVSADGDRRRSGRATSPPCRDNELSGISRGHRRYDDYKQEPASCRHVVGGTRLIQTDCDGLEYQEGTTARKKEPRPACASARESKAAG
jgi:hypothetical protein